MGESCGRNGSTILASGGLPLVLAGGNLLWLQAVHRLLRCCGNKPEQEGDLLWRQLPIRFFNFSVNGPPDTTLTWAEGTPEGYSSLFDCWILLERPKISVKRANGTAYSRGTQYISQVNPA